jgi:hypothetical protein
MEKYLEIIKKAVKQIQRDRESATYKYMYEADFQFALMKHIEAGLLSENLFREVDFYRYDTDDDIKKSVILHAEYPPGSAASSRFDIVLLDEGSMQKKTDQWNNKSINVAIEIKYCWEFSKATLTGFLCDIKKLRENKKNSSPIQVLQFFF